MTINAPQSTAETQEDFFKEKIIPQKFQITKNPQNIPLINGLDTFVDKEGKKREMTSATKVYGYKDQVIIVQEDGIFINDNSGEDFKNIIPQGEENKHWKFNQRTFQSSGDVILSTYVEREGGIEEYEIFINNKKYISPTKGYWNLGNESCLVKCVEDKIYATWGDGMQIINAQQSKLVLLSESDSGDNGYVDVLNDGKIIKQTVKTINDKPIKQIQVNGRDWVNGINNNGASMKYNQNHIWIWNGGELVIDDKRYNLDQRKGTISDHCQISENGNVVAIEFDYNEQGGYGIDYTKLKRGKYILLGDKNGIQKEIMLGDKWIKKIAVDDEGQLAYITQGYTEKKGLLHIDDFTYELDIKDDYYAIKEFMFVGKNAIRIKYLNVRDEIVEQEISLNADAEQVRARLLAKDQEEKNKREIQEFLDKNGLTSVKQLTEMFYAANKYDDLQTRIQEVEGENIKLEMRVAGLKKDNKTLTSEKTTLEQSNKNLTKTIATIKNGIDKRTLGGYTISDNAKTELGLK